MNNSLTVHPHIFFILVRHSMLLSLLLSNHYDNKYIVTIVQKMLSKASRRQEGEG